ncbi:MAG TPA: RNA polymerase sigma factor SigM [Dermatophilaceae bacterium]|nr:RNA polymerase sigma factor SigM [Dermatophilaceae bacterium]
MPPRPPPGPALEDLDDRSLMARHVAGDERAFGELFRRHRDRMWAVAVRVTGDAEEAADAVQDGFLAALRGADRYRGEAEVTTWLHRIVVNACLDARRRARARPRRAGDLASVDLPDPHDRHAGTDTALVVAAALRRLPDAQRAALVLVDVEDLPVAEAAAVLGVPEGTVKSRCARGRATLLALLGESSAPVGEPEAPS